MPLCEEFVFLAFIFGIGIGLICSMVGLGGGILVIPTSIFIFRFSPKDSIFISLFFMSGTVLSASISYIRKKLVNYRLALLYSIGDVPGVIIGGLITVLITNNILAGICGIIIILLSILLYRRRENGNVEIKDNIQNKKVKEENKNTSKTGINNPVIASVSSFAGGVVSGLVGLGGGTIDTTSMILLGLEPKKASATGEIGNFISPISAVIVHLFIGTFLGSWLWPIIMTIGGIIGAQIGVYLTSQVNSNIIRKILACLAFYTGVLMILLMFGIGWIE